MEGLEVTEVVMADRLHYARLFTELWQAGEGFILVEHDVVPWPGAIAQLEACEHECCAFEYPSGGSWCRSLGCTKFSTSLVRRIPYDVEWQNRAWDELDGAVFATLQGEVEMHIHQPPVAHVKARTLILRSP
jgi:hypothetical protein